MNPYSEGMARAYFEEFLRRFDNHGTLECGCGHTHKLGTRTIVAGQGVLESSAELLTGSHGPGVALWVLSDENTEQAAGERWKRGLKAGRIHSRVLPGQPKVVPTMDLVQQLDSEVLEKAPGLLVSVGSGVLSDLVKRVSLDTGIPNWAVATAASVDAYTSATSAIRVGGFHNAVPTGVSETVICDLDVIAGAPREMFLAGLGDLLAKFLAFLDWNLSRIMTGEHYCGLMAGLGVDSARAALDAARRHDTDPFGAARTLTDAVLTSGLAMQCLGNSRSAASAEHTIAHFWETAQAVTNPAHELHGILAGAASRLVLRGYSRFFRGGASALPNAAARLSAYDAERPWMESFEPGLAPYIVKVRDEMGRKLMDRAVLAGRLAAFEEARGEILSLAVPLLDELESAVQTLQGMDYPFSPSELGISADMCMLPSRNVRLLRSRYSTFDLAYELGTDGEIFRAIEDAVHADR